MTSPNHIATLHASYCRLSGLHIGPLDHWTTYLWGDYCRHGFTEQDLFAVVRHIQKTCPEPRYHLKMLRLERLIDPHTFRGHLAEAKAMARNAPKPRDARTDALAAVNRSEPGPQAKVDTERAAGAVAKEILDAGYEQLKKALE